MKQNKSILILSIAFVLCVSSCKKEVFPDQNDIVGTWIEKTTNSDKTQFTFRDNGIAYLTKPNQPTDTLSYILNDSKELLYLSNDAGESNHQIELHKKTDELTIWNLFPSIPENPSEKIFEKK